MDLPSETLDVLMTDVDRLNMVRVARQSSQQQLGDGAWP